MIVWLWFWLCLVPYSVPSRYLNQCRSFFIGSLWRNINFESERNKILWHGRSPRSFLSLRITPCLETAGGWINIKMSSYQYRKSIVEIRRSYDRLISTMGFSILVRWHLYIESGPRCPMADLVHTWLIWVFSLHSALTLWGRDEMAPILQTTLSNAFSSMKKFEFWLKFHWNLSSSIQLTISQHWFR